MEYNERQAYILETIKEKKTLQVVEVKERFQVSDMTVRRDLAELENMGLLVRKFGGASLPNTANQLFAFDDKLHINRSKKEMLCKIAASEIEENDVIFIDSGTTLYFLAQHLTAFNNLRIITNSLPIVSALAGNTKLKVTLLGGEYDDERKALFGTITLKMIKEFHCHKVFIGVDGISLKHGLSSYYEKEADISAAMLEASDKVIVLSDSTKIETDAYIKYAPIEKAHVLVTDKNLTENISKLYSLQNLTIKTHG